MVYYNNRLQTLLWYVLTAQSRCRGITIIKNYSRFDGVTWPDILQNGLRIVGAGGKTNCELGMIFF